MTNTFFVTGGTGFIGANVVRALVQRKQKVSIITRKRESHWRLADIASQLDSYTCDILDPKLEKIITKIKPEYILHFAAYGVLFDENDLERMLDINLKGTINLINAVKKNPFKLFINTSSAVEYGIKSTFMKESDVLEPINDYGVTKAAATLYCQKEAIRNNLPIVNLRLFAPFGYYEDRKRLVPSTILSAIENKPILVSSPTYVRDFIFIEDVIDAYMRALHCITKPGDIFNVGSGKQNSVKDMVETVLQITKSRSQVMWGAVKKQARIIESKRLEADLSKSKRFLRWEPKTSTEKGLEKTIEWFRQHKNLYVSQPL